MAGLTVQVQPSGFPETADYKAFPSPKEYALYNATQKAKSIDPETHILISADTIVEISGTVLEKAESPEKAYEMITMLNNKSHNVHTALVVKYLANTIETITTTSVVFGNIDHETILAYVNSLEYEDKAGAYGIQDGTGGSFIKEICGDFYNVMGLPLYTLCKSLISVLDN